MTWPATVASASPGGVGGAADFNNHRDALNAVGGAWTPYSVSWTGATADPTLGATTIAGRYRLMGKTVDIHISITIGAGFAAGTGAYRFTLPAGITPVTIASLEAMGYAMALDSSSSTGAKAGAYMFSGTAISLLGDTGVWAAAVPWVWAVGDRISIHMPSIELA